MVCTQSKDSVGIVTVIHDKLVCIVEKPVDTRERYAYYAIGTLKDPFDAWITPSPD